MADQADIEEVHMEGLYEEVKEYEQHNADYLEPVRAEPLMIRGEPRAKSRTNFFTAPPVGKKIDQHVGQEIKNSLAG